MTFAYQKNFSLQAVFFKKDVAESVEARKVTRSFLTVGRISTVDLGFELQPLPMIGEPWPVASKAFALQVTFGLTDISILRGG